MFGISFRRGVIDFNLVFFVKDVEVGAIRKVFTLYFFEEETAILHGPKEAPKSTSTYLVLIA